MKEAARRARLLTFSVRRKTHGQYVERHCQNARCSLDLHRNVADLNTLARNAGFHTSTYENEKVNEDDTISQYDYVRLNVCQATQDLQTHLVLPRKRVPDDHFFRDLDRTKVFKVVKRGEDAQGLNIRVLVAAGGNMQLEIGVVFQA